MVPQFHPQFKKSSKTEKREVRERGKKREWGWEGEGEGERREGEYQSPPFPFQPFSTLL